MLWQRYHIRQHKTFATCYLLLYLTIPPTVNHTVANATLAITLRGRSRLEVSRVSINYTRRGRVKYRRY